MCGQFVWPCPRNYPSDLAARRNLKILFPEDMSKREVGEVFKKVVCQVGQLPHVDRLHIFNEPRKKYNPATGQSQACYCVQPSAGKLQSDLDSEQWSWPERM